MARAQTRRKRALPQRLAALLLAFILALGLIPGIPLGAQVAYAERSVELRIERQVPYSNTFTNYMYADGNIAFCAEPGMYTPAAGAYSAAPVDPRTVNPDNGYRPEDIAACLWFGYDGPGFDATMWPSAWFDGTPMSDDRYLVLTHIVLGDFFTCNGLLALEDVTGGLRSWALQHVLMMNAGVYNPGSVQAQMRERAGEVPPEFTASCFQLNPGGDKQTIIGYTPGGWLDLQKASADTSITDDNPCYALEGARYGIFRDGACADKATELACDAQGRAKSGYLRTGTYYVKELAAPRGYALDPAVHRVEVRKGACAHVNGGQVKDAPLRSTADMIVAKLDAETGAAAPQGGASLADAQFTVRYYRGHHASAQAAEQSGPPARTWVVRTDEDGHARLSDSHLVSGDAFYRASDGRAAIPLGTLLIQETKAPAGYHLSDERVHVRQVTAAGTTETSTAYNPPSVADQVFRGDVEFVKARESDQNRLAGIPFLIRDNTTGEGHIVVTDANGQASTAALWNGHTAKTNANDAALRADGTVDEALLDPTAGVWFGSSRPDDAKGALPYGTYTIEELRVSGNAGLALIRMPSLTIGEREGYVVGLGTFDDQALSECAITTRAREYQTGDKNASADHAARIIDRVQYANLDVSEGGAYELRATLVDAQSGEAIADASGAPVGGSARFTPTQPNGYAEVTIAFDSRALAGRDVVVFEELVKVSTGAVVAEHEDAADYDQTVHIDTPTLRTSAADAHDGDKIVPADPQARITDTVQYRNLIAGAEYELRGELWVKGAGDEGADDAVALTDQQGEPCTAQKTFTPEHRDGSHEVTFTCDTSQLDGREVVVLERLYRDGELIAEHADICDSAQTVSVREPRIATVVADVLDGDDSVAADEGSRVIDTVRYEDVIPGEEYTLRGELMLKARAAEDAEGATRVESLRDADGQPVVGTTVFTPQESGGQTEVAFAFDSRLGDGDDIVVYETLLRDEVIVAEDKDPDNADQSFSVHATSAWTYLADARTQAKQITADAEAALIDTVRYADAVLGSRYTAYGLLVDPDSGLPVLQHADADDDEAAVRAEQMMRELLIAAGADPDAESLASMYADEAGYPRAFDGDALRAVIERYPDIAERLAWAERSFTAEGTSGETTLAYALDARGLEGERATSCVIVVKDSSGEAVCGEADLENDDQTIIFVTGAVRTIATDATDGDHALLNSREARITDEVAYEGLTAGKEHILEGMLYDRATGEPLLVGDKPVTATKYFVPAASSGTESVTFTFDASGLGGQSVVAYEHLYREMDPGDGRSERSLVALHADLRSEEQTVRIEGRTPPAGSGYDKTGDTSGPVLAAALGAGIIALAGAAYGIRQMASRNRRAQMDAERALRGLR